MKKSEIRPHTTYLGHDGLLRKVKSIEMAITGDLSVEWKAVAVPRNFQGGRWSIHSIGSFAKWAKTITQTCSDDLQHYTVKEEG